MPGALLSLRRHDLGVSLALQVYGCWAPLECRGVALAAPTLGRPLARRLAAVRAPLAGRSLAMTPSVPPEQTLRASVDRRGDPPSRRVCIVGASGKLGTYMVEHAIDRGYEVVAVCRE